MRRMELDDLILRWKKTTRALRVHEQAYGRHLTDVLERVTDAQLVHFRDPVEAAAFFCMLDLIKKTHEVNPGGIVPVPEPPRFPTPQTVLFTDPVLSRE